MVAAVGIVSVAVLSPVDAAFAGELAQSQTNVDPAANLDEVENRYAEIAVWALPALVLILVAWAVFRHLDRSYGKKREETARLRGQGTSQSKPKTATQLRAQEIHRDDDWQNPLDEYFETSEDSGDQAWVVDHTGNGIDFDWNDELGFHDRRTERREKHAKDPREDRPPPPDLYEGQRDSDAELRSLPFQPPRPYLGEVDAGDAEHPAST